jgi:hypothetical protein
MPGSGRRGRSRLASRRLVEGSSGAMDYEPIIISAEEFEAAKRDPKVIEFHREAMAYLERVCREGRGPDLSYPMRDWFGDPED